MKLHTQNLTSSDGVFTLDENDGVTMISFQMSSDTGDKATLLGTESFNNVASEAVEISAGGGCVFQSAPNSSIALTIQVLQGTLKVIMGFGS